FLARAIRRESSRPEQDRTFALTLTAMLLLSPITWDHYAVVLLLPVALLWLQLPTGGLALGLFGVCLLALWLTPMVYWYPLIGARIETWMFMVAEPWQTLTALSIPTYALVGLFALGLSLALPHETVSSTGPVS